MHHALLDDRSLAFARAIAERLRERPELMQVARENLHRWMKRHADSPALLRCDREWAEILASRSFDEVIGILVRDDDEGQRLRQNHPFTDILTPGEVSKIRREFAHEAR
jgi:hypothetical protein